MYIPKEMNKVIASVFYDKTVKVLESVTETDSEGGVISKGITEIDSFKGNVSFSNCKKIQEDFGLDYDIDIAITTDYTEDLFKKYLKYNDIVYAVTDIKPYDSHVLILGKVWKQ